MPYDGAVGGFRLRWDVFLSFRGEDTRHTITNSIYNALERRGVRVFRDDDGLNRGDDIAPSLLEAIEDSAAAVVVLSPRYADSRWCLEELAKICDGGRRLILPVFYQVDPSDVRRQSGPFEKDFRAHEERFESNKVSKWKNAMAKVGGKAGFVVNSSNEAELIQSLVKTVLAEINKIPVGLAAYTVGLDSRIEDVMRLLDVRSSDVRVVGVHGMGGVGKTTLAKAIFNKLVGHFGGHCFVSNVREVSAGPKGLVSLQNKLITDLSPGKVPVNDLETGISAIKAVVSDERVLVVLDDVDNVNQLSALVGKGQWFNEGSRIIITTRDRGLLASYLVNFKLYEVRELDVSQALQLFSYHALRRDKPTDNLLNLSKEIVSLTGGLPLALEVFGSFLFDKRRIEEWTDALHKLNKIRPQHLQDVLKISYDALDEQEKCVFLDIACLIVKMNAKREDAIDILRSCGFDGEIAIADLTAKSLIKITEDTTLWMHDQVRDMGRQIVRHESLLDPGMRSRLWEHDKIMNVFKDDMGTRCIQGIVLEDLDTERKMKGPRDLTGDKISWNSFQSSPNFTSAVTYLKERYKVYLQNQAEKKSRVTIPSKPFGAMVNLRLLQMNYVNLEGSFKFLPSELKWLQWKGCPLKSLPSVLFLGRLAGLDLSDSRVERLCSGHTNKVAEKLMFLNLSGCSVLTAIPDLSGNHALEKLILKNCVGLIKLHDSIGNLNTLIHLNLQDCTNLVELPSDFSGLRKLENLILTGCSKLKRLPKNIGSLVSLKKLLLDETAIESLPEDIFHLTKLEKLSLNRCRVLKGLPEEIGKLCSLKEISLNGCGLEKLPDSIGSLANLEILSLFWCQSLTTIPNSLGDLNNLMEFFTYGTPIEELPLSFGSLSNLKELSVGHGKFLRTLPGSIGGLKSLVVLKIDETSITGLPQEISALKTLEKLELRKCESLRSLPESIGSMWALTSIIITAANITELPESIGRLENLTMLQLNRCKQFCKLPASIGQLKSLHRLQMVETAVTELPESFGMLSSLMVLSMGKKPQNGRHTEEKFILPASFSNLSMLSELDARACNISGEIPDDFEKLSSLETLNLSRNSFCRLPASLSGLSTLQKLSLPRCKKLKSLPPLPSSLKEVDVANCVALESISDVSNLENLTDFNLTNCEKVLDIPGIECLDSLTRLFMSGCNSCSSAVKKRLAKKSYLRRIRTLSIPGSKIPDWFSQDVITFSERKNHVLKGLIIAVVVSLNHQIPDDLREELPAVVDIVAKILILDSPTFTSTLVLSGVPNTNEDQFFLCRYPISHPLVFQLKDGYKIHVERREPPYVKGVELKKWGIHLVYEGDDDYEEDEESLKESQQSLSEKLAKFFGSFDEEADSTSTHEQNDFTSESSHNEDEGMAQEMRESDRRYFISFFLVLSFVFLLLSWFWFWFWV
ncbi:disease resistance protein RPV1-like [Rosa rugosa]|uniref:disease resistance protein RPV1-like n=1 Tax=Rosa rugosa TaxID=74645 RepID=UPI002B41467F|nr:disease resistance protein RPV1-like [Rosa rugosa]XP_061991026.1 disease resistance protein RPV1-like [Rosa rugosa]